MPRPEPHVRFRVHFHRRVDSSDKAIPDPTQTPAAKSGAATLSCLLTLPVECTPTSGQMRFRSLDRLPVVLLLELDWAALANRCVQPLGNVDVLDEARERCRHIVERLAVAQVDVLHPERLQEVFCLCIVVWIAAGPISFVWPVDWVEMGQRSGIN